MDPKDIHDIDEPNNSIAPDVLQRGIRTNIRFLRSSLILLGPEIVYCGPEIVYCGNAS